MEKSFLAQFYPVKVVFKRRFTRGNLKGLIHEDQIHHIDAGTAQEWIEGIQRNGKRGALDYVLETACIVDSHTGNPIQARA